MGIVFFFGQVYFQDLSRKPIYNFPVLTNS